MLPEHIWGTCHPQSDQLVNGTSVTDLIHALLKTRDYRCRKYWPVQRNSQSCFWSKRQRQSWANINFDGSRPKRVVWSVFYEVIKYPRWWCVVSWAGWWHHEASSSCSSFMCASASMTYEKIKQRKPNKWYATDQSNEGLGDASRCQTEGIGQDECDNQLQICAGLGSNWHAAQ